MGYVRSIFFSFSVSIYFQQENIIYDLKIIICEEEERTCSHLWDTMRNREVLEH